MNNLVVVKQGHMWVEQRFIRSDFLHSAMFGLCDLNLLCADTGTHPMLDNHHAIVLCSPSQKTS